jgi:hypothetical protein
MLSETGAGAGVPGAGSSIEEKSSSAAAPSATT